LSSDTRPADTRSSDTRALHAEQVLDLTGEITPVPELLRDLKRHWRLMPVLARQDFAARYRSASLGLAWSVFLPLLQAAVLALVFRRIVRINTSGLNYPIFVITAITTWSYFNSSVTSGSTAITDTGILASRVYFPRMLMPAMPAVSNLISYAISLAVLVILMPIESVSLSWRLLLLPVLVAGALALAIAFSEVTALLHVYFRDTRYVVVAVNIPWFYATPIIYPLSLVHGLRPWIIANPATGLIQAARWIVFGTATDVGISVLVTIAWTIGLLGIALVAFRSHDRNAVDRL
jgi:lipopolysaccharide transport system permease protein